MKRIRRDSDRIAIIQALLDGVATAPDIIETTGVKMANVYACLRSFTNNGWLVKTNVEGTGRRCYQPTYAGVRAFQ